MPSPLAWALTSPARLLAVVTAIALAVVAVAVAASVATSPSPAADGGQPGLTANSSTEVVIPSSSAHEDGEDDLAPADRRKARRTLDVFLRRYLAARSTSDLRQLRKVSTSTLATGLEQTDPRALPDGPVREVTETAAGAFLVSYDVALPHQTLVVDVVRDTGTWRVASIEPASP